MTRVAGFGFRKGTGIESLLDALMMAGGTRDLVKLATVATKAEAPGLLALSERLGLPIHPVAPEDLPHAGVLTISQKSLDIHGTGSVSEAAALVAAGPQARLIAPRVLSADHMAICAIAETIDPSPAMPERTAP